MPFEPDLVASPPAPLHHAVLAIDVAASGRRDDQLLLRMRADLREIVSRLLRQQRLDDSVDEWVDLGDGVRLVMAVGVTPAAMLDPFVHNLESALREHRKAASEQARLRLRMAVHMGLLHQDGGGFAGAPLRHIARLLDAESARDALDAADDANLVVVLSEAVYDGVVRHGFGVDAAACRPVTIEVKETRATAWLHIPGARWVDPAQPPGPTGGQPIVGPAARTGRTAPEGLLNPYIRRARLQPLALCLLPLAPPLLLVGPALPVWAAVLVVPAVVLLPVVVDQLVRDRGLQVEARLYARWGGTPTTQLLRWAGPTNPARQAHVHAHLQRLIGPTTVLPTAEEERQDPRQADEAYDAAVAVLRAWSRADSPSAHLVQLENRNYGFRRNTYGLKWLGAGLSLLGCAAGAWLIPTTVAGWAVLVVEGGLLMFWLTVVGPAWVRRAAWTYAQRLIETIELAPERR